MSKDAGRIIQLYQDRAAEWDAIRPRRLMEKAWLDRFIARCRGRIVLDIGCGAGEPTRAT